MVGEVCEHGSLARSCEVCWLAAEVGRLKAEVERWRAMAIRALDIADRAEADSGGLLEQVTWLVDGTFALIATLLGLPEDMPAHEREAVVRRTLMGLKGHGAL